MSVEPKAQSFWCEKIANVCVVLVREHVKPSAEKSTRREVTHRELHSCNEATRCGVRRNEGHDWGQCVHPISV